MDRKVSTRVKCIHILEPEIAIKGRLYSKCCRCGKLVFRKFILDRK